jgi:hypothetical protein
MRLGPAEQRAFDHLVRAQRQWRWLRFVWLFLSGAIVAAGIWLHFDVMDNLLSTTRQMSFTKSLTGAEVFWASQFGGQLAVADLIPMLGGACLGFTLGRWRGNPVHHVLIGLASRLTTPDAKVEQP